MLNVKNISFGYTKNEQILKNLSFSVTPGENIAVIGKSGSGKSTLLKLINGQYDLYQGEITWKNTPILGPAYNLVTGYPFIKHVAQEFNLMPYTTVFENVGKHLSNFYLNKKTQRINELLEIVEMTAFAQTKVKHLSGGQKQRIALARALANVPEILLLDEPFSHIDNFKKQSLRKNLFNYLKENNITCITATHDKKDVLRYSNRMLVLKNGIALANNTPKALYNDPKNNLIASFFGEYNLINEEDLTETKSNKTCIVYINELNPSEIKNGFKVTVVKSCFNGHNYLVEAMHNKQLIFFTHNNSIVKNTVVYLNYTGTNKRYLD